MPQQVTEEQKTHQIVEILIKSLLSVVLACLYIWYALDTKANNQKLIINGLDKITKYEKFGYDSSKFRKDLQAKNIEINEPLYLVSFWKFNDQEAQIRDIETRVQYDYDNSIAKRRYHLREEINKLEQKLSTHANSNLASYDKALQSLDEAKARVNIPELGLQEADVLLKKVADVNVILDKEIEAMKRQQLFGEIIGYNTEADKIIEFFARRQGYETEIEMVKKYKQNSEAIMSDKYKDSSADELKMIAHAQIFPLLDKPKKTKAIVEEQERLIREAKQKEIFEKYGVPPPPFLAYKLIVVDIAAQRLYAYEDGISIFNYPVPVTTGKNGYSTVYGQFAIYTKASPFRMRSPFPNEHYDLKVSFWMPFFEGYGLHDAPWRSYFGGGDFVWNGSHGCVNIPYYEVEKIFYWADIGTPVVVR